MINARASQSGDVLGSGDKGISPAICSEAIDSVARAVRRVRDLAAVVAWHAPLVPSAGRPFAALQSPGVRSVCGAVRGDSLRLVAALGILAALAIILPETGHASCVRKDTLVSLHDTTWALLCTAVGPFLGDGH
jgi:hypothetical protein